MNAGKSPNEPGYSPEVRITRRTKTAPKFHGKKLDDSSRVPPYVEGLYSIDMLGLSCKTCAPQLGGKAGVCWLVNRAAAIALCNFCS